MAASTSGGRSRSGARMAGARRDGATMDPLNDDLLNASVAEMSGRGRRRVFIDRLELIGRVGVYAHEQRYEQRVAVSLDLSVSDDYDGHSDRLEQVYDYDRAIRAVKDTLYSGHFNLIETLAEQIAEACLQDARVRRVWVR